MRPLRISATFATLLALASAPVVRANEYAASVLFPLTNPEDSWAAAGQVVGSAAVSGNQHALLWSTGGAVDLNPSGFDYSLAWATDGSRQGGIVSGGATGGNSHAALWTGSAGSFLDLHPTGFAYSAVIGIGGAQQVGYADDHAMLWSGSAAGVVNLGPGVANGTDGTHQVGESYDGRALLWSGTAASVVDLGPGAAYGTSGTQQVGYAGNHAMLWSGSDASAVDLGFGVAYGTNGTQQVGNVGNHATLWSGTEASATDLHALLDPSRTWFRSRAYSIDAAGNVFGTATTAVATFAVEWSPVPEPSSLTALGLGALFAARRRRAGRAASTKPCTGGRL